MLNKPTPIYINWAAYDELSDNVELTETLAMRQLDELLRLRDAGVALDYYLMDCFWYAPDGGYRTWRTPNWPDGPDRWLARCQEYQVKPGLWVSSNVLTHMEPAPAWLDSLDPTPGASRGMCCFHGGFLPDFIDVLGHWYDRGVRLFKFDFADFGAAPAHLHATMLPSEIRAANMAAFRGALKAFRQTHPEVVLLAYNGYEEVGTQWTTSLPLRKTIDPRWLDTFDALYCGDPRPADVPAMSFWRSKDVYSDHMVRYYLANEVPPTRIDNAGFMVGTTGTCYFRGTAAWQGMLLLSMARGGWANTYYGNLDLLDAERAAWFAKAQRLYYPLQAGAQFSTFGGWPGKGEAYGFAYAQADGGVLTVVNPGQCMAALPLPLAGPMRLLFRDAGYLPTLEAGRITLGPEQMAVIGVGAYADAAYDLGVQEDVQIPTTITPLAAPFTPEGEGAICTTVSVPEGGTVRVVMRQHDTRRGLARRTSGGDARGGTTLGHLLTLAAEQDGQPLPVTINYDKAIWSGLSWAAGEVVVPAGAPVTLRCATSERGVTLTGEAYLVSY